MVYQRVEPSTKSMKAEVVLPSSTKKKERETTELYDPLGVHRAVSSAIEGPTWWRAVGASVVNQMVLLGALSPLLLLPLALLTVFVLDLSAWVSVPSWGLIIWAGLFCGEQFYQLLFNHSDNTMQPTAACPGRRGTVIVIGAGPVGLATVKECAAEGLDVQCFERRDGVGGVFRFNSDITGGCWPTVKLTTSPWVTAYSDFPPVSESSKHLSAEEYVQYLERYIDHFALAKHLHFNQSVTAVKQMDDGRWQVTVVDQASGETVTHDCDRVAISVGLNLHPKPVSLPGQKTFSGEIRHSAHYKGPEGLAGKRVVVVGAGESGADIATELSHIARKTYLSLRKGRFIIPRTNPLNGVANDYDTNRLRYALPVPLRNWFMSFERKICFHTGEHTPEAALRAQLLAASGVGPSSQTATKSDDFVRRVLLGKLSLRKQVVGFDREHVIFADGQRELADSVIFAHGYVPAFPFLFYPHGVAARHPGEMFLNMFHPDLGDSVAFCGFARPAIGAIPPTGELQARLFAQVAAGKLVLPARSELLKAIERDKRENVASFPNQPQPNAVVNWIPYMDRVARLIGCKPQSLRLWAQPKLLWRLFTGPMTGAYYRLQGPGENAIAWQTLKKLPRMHRVREILIYAGLHFWSWPWQVWHPHPRWRRPTTIL